MTIALIIVLSLVPLLSLLSLLGNFSSESPGKGTKGGKGLSTKTVSALVVVVVVGVTFLCPRRRPVGDGGGPPSSLPLPLRRMVPSPPPSSLSSLPNSSADATSGFFVTCTQTLFL